MKFGIIGTNFVSEFFMDGANQVDTCDVVAVCDVFEEKAKAFAKQHNIANYFTSYEDMCSANIIDAVYIAVPNSLHFKIASYFLNHKIPTFCEKPLASNAKEVEALVSLAQENNVYFQEGLIPLYNPNYKTLKEKLDLVGPIHQVNLNFSKYSSRYDAYLAGENPTTFRGELSNGATMDLGVYVTAFCIGLFGEPKRILSAASLLDTKSDVAGSSLFVYDGFIANLTYSKASDTNIICEICGEHGILTIDQPSQPQVIQFIGRKDKSILDLSVKPMENFYYEITEMIQNIDNKKTESTSVPLSTTLAVHRTLTEMRKQAAIVFPSDK